MDIAVKRNLANGRKNIVCEAAYFARNFMGVGFYQLNGNHSNQSVTRQLCYKSNSGEAQIGC